jgi:hypothetical protein
MTNVDVTPEDGHVNIPKNVGDSTFNVILICI